MPPPYPPSQLITGVVWDWSTYVRLANGSDNWPITWADDNHQYTSWGDGSGFASSTTGRWSLGFARVQGDWNNYQGFNVWGGGNTENPAQFEGKSYGILSVNGILYAWWGPLSDLWFATETRVLISTDHSRTWTQSTWRWTDLDNLYGGSFLNFGRDYAGARDTYVYSYFPRGSTWALQIPGSADLARVPKDRIMDQSAYEWFAGFDLNGNPTWTPTLSARRPVFEDPNGLRTVSVGYDPGLGRYLLTSQHTKVEPRSDVDTDQWGLFEGPEPWGPWRTVAYYTAIDNWGNTKGHISFYFAPKWFSPNGKDFTLVFTNADSWGTVRGAFTTTSPGPPVASFIASPVEGPAPLAVTFTDQSISS